MASRASSERPSTSNAMKEIRKLRAGENLFAWLMMALSLFVLIQAYLISGFSSISSAGTFPMVAAAIMVVAMALTLLNNRKLAKPDADGLKDELHRALVVVQDGGQAPGLLEDQRRALVCGEAPR